MRKKGTVGISLLIGLLFLPLATSSQEVVQEVYLLVRERELLAFSAPRNRWVTLDLAAREKVLESKYGGRVAVAVTNFRVLGFSALTSRWAEQKLMVGESVETIDATGNIGAAITNLRAFGFNASTGRWIPKRFELK
jgi:hypothetical protein